MYAIQCILCLGHPQFLASVEILKNNVCGLIKVDIVEFVMLGRIIGRSMIMHLSQTKAEVITLIYIQLLPCVPG